MITTFAHAGHTDSMATMGIDHCTPIIIGASIIIFILLATITYMVMTWQPKSFTGAKKPATSPKKKTTKK